MVLMRAFVIKLGRKPTLLPNFLYFTAGKYQHCFRTIKLYSTVELPSELTSTGTAEDNWRSKIIFNEILHKEDVYLKLQERRNKVRINVDEFSYKDSLPKATSVFLKCVSDNTQKKNEIPKDNSSPSVVHFPFRSQERVLVDGDSNIEQSQEEDIDCNAKEKEYDTEISAKSRKNIEFEDPRKWETQAEEEILCDDSRFGSCDPNCPVSNVPCGGCGALLHCTNMSIPGFMPKEIFKQVTEAELRRMTCQRCLFLKEYNVALGINVDPDEYPKILSQIKGKKALVLLMVDLLDFPCSIWPNLPQIIGPEQPFFLVGNKVDLLIQDGEDFLKHRKKCLINALKNIDLDVSKVLHTSLISAKTGYGVESLITHLYNLWGTKGDIYIVGCTNVGKSTLFNTLIQSDLCKVKAVDLLQRATVSPWPGTTLNLVKFPLLKPHAWRRSIRSKRLQVTTEQEEALRELKRASVRNREKDRQILLMGYIGRTFREETAPGTMTGLNPNDPEYQMSKWCYDTPGVVHEAQILTLLTTHELSKVLPRRTVIPRNFKLKPGHSLFIGGLARLDFVSGSNRAWFTVYASDDLPVTVTNIEDADFVYRKLTGTNFFVVPQGSEERLKKWPELMAKELKVYGKFPGVGAGDVVLSSAGWVAITTDPVTSCNLRAWTPEGRGIFLREPSVIRKSSSYRKGRIRGTPAYARSVTVVEDEEFDIALE